MEEQFLPPVRKPLDAPETLRFGEEEAERDRIDNINYMTGLAVLNVTALGGAPISMPGRLTFGSNGAIGSAPRRRPGSASASSISFTAPPRPSAISRWISRNAGSPP